MTRVADNKCRTCGLNHMTIVPDGSGVGDIIPQPCRASNCPGTERVITGLVE